MVQVSGISLHVEDHGSGKPVLLLHGWPDSAYLWRNQIPFLVNNGFHAIAPDLRGFGRSDRPEGVPAYSLQNVVGDVVGILDGLGIGPADIVGHDWGAAVAWFLAAMYPNRVHKLVILSVPHPLAPRTLRQAGNGLVPALLPVRGNRRGVAAARRLGVVSGDASRKRGC
jgi:pimeloyl-ACP methyl ester carboxylesterase